MTRTELLGQAELGTRLRDAVCSMILNQWELAALDVGERTVTSHLFRHMAVRFDDSGFDVDHEYNRRRDRPKTVDRRGCDELGERRVFPDLIVHRRSRDDSNLVVIEAKKGACTDDNDEDKVQKLLSQHQYRYEWGVLLALGMTVPQENGEVSEVGPYRAWAPSWQWLKLDAASVEVESEPHDRMFDGDELDHLNEEGWQR
ncbi:MAG: hypothetical protein ACC652_03230, partial [Acidimicrobiales bacterium]